MSQEAAQPKPSEKKADAPKHETQHQATAAESQPVRMIGGTVVRDGSSRRDIMAALVESPYGD